jgi:hypothetical protein
MVCQRVKRLRWAISQRQVIQSPQVIQWQPAKSLPPRLLSWWRLL